MKTEHTETPPRFNLMKPDGVRSQGHARDVTHVMLNNGHTYPIQPGSFKFYRVNSNTGVPYVTFIVSQNYGEFGSYDEDGRTARDPLAGQQIEVFPASITGIAYDAKVEESEEDSDGVSS